MLLYLVVWVWELKNWFFLLTTLSLDPYPRIAGDSHILFQPITAISSLLDLFGPLPQGRRLFGPTVLESRQPSRNLPIFSGIVYRWEEKRTSSPPRFSIFTFGIQAGGWKKIAKAKIMFKKLQVDFISYWFLFYVQINVTAFRFNVKKFKVITLFTASIHQYFYFTVLLY